jgi:diadenosine tetraphosphate (Ap4A) HIT family hydrolase
MKCIFCKIPSRDFVFENEYFFVIPDKYPVAQGHHLIISKQHRQDYFELSEQESVALLDISRIVRSWLDGRYQPSGYNLAMNCGKSAGQTIFHFHLHIIPRY